MTAPNADVIVVGAGPAGSATARLLVERGIDVLLLDRVRFPREKPCGEYLNPGVIDLLERLGALERILSGTHGTPAGMLIRGHGTDYLLRYHDANGIRPAIGVQRPLLDQAILEAALQAGARVEQPVRVTGTVREAGRVTGVEVASGDRRSILRARLVIGADGLHSTVARSLGLDRPVRWPRRLGLIARYRVPAGSFPSAEMLVGRDVYCGLNPVGPNLINVGLVCSLNAKRPGEPTDRLFERLLATIPHASDRLAGASRITPIRGRGPLARRVRRSAGPGYLLVGDAAEFFDPFTGEGIFRALRGAFLAADAAARALARSDAVPIGYERDRRRAFRDKQIVCVMIQAFLRSERLFGHLLSRLPYQERAERSVSGVLGDLRPAREALHPLVLWSLLGP